MSKKTKVNFPKGFFTKSRPVVLASKVLKNVIPADLEDISLVAEVENKKLSKKKDNK